MTEHEEKVEIALTFIRAAFLKMSTKKIPDWVIRIVREVI